MLRLIFFLFFSATAVAEEVVLVWGDSVIGGLNSAMPPVGGPVPLPSNPTVPGAWRWDHANSMWKVVDNQGNINGDGLDPVYGFAEAYVRNGHSPIYFIEMATQASDCNPNHPNPVGSWHPTVPNGLIHTFDAHIAAAFGQLSNPQIHCIWFSTGNVAPPSNGSLLPGYIDDVNDHLIGMHQPTANPILLGTQSYVLSSPNTATNRQQIPIWANGPGDRRFVDLLGYPGAYGGLPDTVHMHQLGCVMYGRRAGFEAL